MIITAVSATTLRVALMQAASREPMSGASITKAVRSCFAPSRIETTSIYTGLRRLTESGLMQMDGPKGARTFQLNDAGRAHLDACVSVICRVVELDRAA